MCNILIINETFTFSCHVSTYTVWRQNWQVAVYVNFPSGEHIFPIILTPHECNKQSKAPPPLVTVAIFYRPSFKFSHGTYAVYDDNGDNLIEIFSNVESMGCCFQTDVDKSRLLIFSWQPFILVYWKLTLASWVCRKQSALKQKPFERGPGPKVSVLTRWLKVSKLMVLTLYCSVEVVCFSIVKSYCYFALT